VLLGWWLVRIGLWPLREVERTASAITAGDLTVRVPGEDSHTEVGKVALAINSMLGQIERAFAERDRTEAELRTSENRLRRFVADASHELRTPIAAVAAYSELFSKGASERHDDLERVMAGIRSETARMGSLVQDLLLLARLDEGRPLERQSVEVVAIVSEAIRTAETVDARWPVSLTATRPLELYGDARQLRQVVDNLLANVRAHTPAGTATTVRVARRDSFAVIEVEDDGPGIATEQAPRLFERFYRADPSRTRVTGGAGLGLAIVAAIVAAHQGRVEVTPVDPHGSNFRVLLPLGEQQRNNGPSASP
jgi:two-component system OmpR family sensor kinase